ncbi:MAG: histidine kinase [Deltaproteobacteria bacterium]|nr:histidine kinase [Deltaproteobacteria bacterium]
MWKRLSLRSRIFIILAALVLTTLGGGLVTIWHNEAMDTLFTSLVDNNVRSFQAAAELEAALLAQKGFATYYFLDANPQWLKQLDQYHQTFLEWLEKARKSAYTEPMREILNDIGSRYTRYIEARNQVLLLYREGDREEGARLHQGVRLQFNELSDLCERYQLIQEYAINRARTESQTRARFINTLALIIMPSVVVLALVLAYILLKQILEPIRRLALETGPPTNPAKVSSDEVKALSRRVHRLMDDVDQAQTQLERSQEYLLQSEKWAMVGKLAAGVAHSIRNPLTSVKMRLFSMERHLQPSPAQKEDFEVISEEIRHIDAIVRNFLEFSRPPKLKMAWINPSEVVDMTLQLLRHRLDLYGVKVEVKRMGALPEILADPEQLKEVLVNLLVNACEAMPGGGQVTISEEVIVEPGGRAVVLQVTDNGPGIPPSIQDKVFQPFYSTKEEGTGLGLSIASRIVEEHGGSLALESRENEGAAFIITLPIREGDEWAIL